MKILRNSKLYLIYNTYKDGCTNMYPNGTYRIKIMFEI